MDLAQQQEAFSRAYVHAVVCVAGYRVCPPSSPDDDSVDLGIAARGPLGVRRSPRIEAQLKTIREPVQGDPWPFELKVKNYEDLRHVDYHVPRILVVVSLPHDLSSWLHQTEERLALHHCGYWVSLLGMPPTTNTTSVTVKIPRTQVFSVEGVREIMARVGQGGAP